MADLSGELVEVPPLDSLQPVGDAVQRCVGRGVVPDARDGAFGVAKVTLEGGVMPSTA